MDIDSAIFIGFLVINIVLGLSSSRGIKNIKEYAIGNRDFSTAAITCTIVATWISGGVFFKTISESYNNGLYYMWASAGSIVNLLILGYFFAPRLSEFLGKISIAEAMGELYGKPVRIITALAGFIGVSGVIATQLKVSGLLFEYCFNVPSFYGVIISGIIVTLYSTLGGIKAVTFTDIIQFFTFGTIIPTIAFFVFTNLDSIDLVTNTLSNNKSFDYREVFDFSQPKSFYYLFLFLYMSTQAFSPAIFQRISMAKNVNQVRKSFVIAGFTCFFLTIMFYWISILLLSINPNLEPNNIVKHLIFDSSYVGLRGLILAGIMAMVMSTADSYINSTAVLIVHDFCKPLGINLVKNELNFARLASLLIGVFSIILGLQGASLLQLTILTFSFYMPIVTVPFIMSLLGFRSSGKSVLIAMFAGFVTVVIWEIFLKKIGIDPIVPGMFANLVFLLGSHYLLAQPGGWVGIKDYGPVIQIRQERRLKIRNFIKAARAFSLSKFFGKNSPSTGPGGEENYVYLGLFCMISALSSLHMINKEFQLEYRQILDFILPAIVFTSTLLLSYPLWLQSWRKTSASSFLWHFAIFYILICTGFILAVISKFAPLPLTAFIMNLVVIAALLQWQLVLIMIVSGVILTSQFCKYYFGVNYLLEQYSHANFETTYIILVISGILMTFIRPKQEYTQLIEEKAEHLTGRIDSSAQEVQEALALKTEFIRNVTHEYHAPMTGIISMAETLVESYDKLNDKQRYKAARVILHSSRSLKVFDENIATLSRLNKPNYTLHKEPVDLSDLVLSRVNLCRKLYEQNIEDREFILDIQEGIITSLDKEYIIQLIDNLIINAITYCKKGKIHIILNKDKENINLIIEDEGIGIPKTEIYDIFQPFTVSSKTKTQAGGRGLGLTICKRILEVHEGAIAAESNGEKGARFRAVLPY